MEKDCSIERFKGNKDNRVFFQCVQSCGEPVMITDLKGVLAYVNPAWTRTYGFSEEEALGHTPRILRSLRHESQFYQSIWKQIKDPHIGYWKGELVNLNKEGHEVPVLLTITPLRAEDGSTFGYMGIALDLTEEKQLRAQIEQQDRLATIGILTSGMAHEIGTPIGVIRGRAEMLLMDNQLKNQNDERLVKNLEIIIKQTDRISGFINSLLKLSRSAGDQHLESLDAANVIRGVLDLLAPKIRNTQIQLEVNLAENLIAYADIGRLEQIIINLVVNAIHAIEKKREASVALESSQYIRIFAFRSTDQIKVSIEDSGCGIPEENMKKIFEPFFTTKPAGQGTGLGLSIVNRIVNEMGGAISVKSREGKGTTFTFTLKPQKDFLT